MRRMCLHIMVIKGAHAYWEDDDYGYIMLIISGSVYVIHMYMQIKYLLTGFKTYDTTVVLRPQSKMNQFYAKAMDFTVLEIVYEKMSLAGSEQALE